VSAAKAKSAWLSTMVAVLWGFLGVRRNSDYQQDVKRLNPLHIMLVGVLMTFLFVAGLMMLVTWIT
jgi:hypothetical protein